MKCKYVLIPAKPGKDAVYCDKDTRFKIRINESGTKHRKYEPFCPDHSEKPDLGNLVGNLRK